MATISRADLGGEERRDWTERSPGTLQRVL